MVNIRGFLHGNNELQIIGLLILPQFDCIHKEYKTTLIISTDYFAIHVQNGGENYIQYYVVCVHWVFLAKCQLLINDQSNKGELIKRYFFVVLHSCFSQIRRTNFHDIIYFKCAKLSKCNDNKNFSLVFFA